MKFNNFLKFLLSIIICELAGAIGSFFTTPEINGWYGNLNKPSFSPPNWVFGPVWTILFVLMGIAFYLVWIKKWEPKNTIGMKNRKAWNKISQKFYDGPWRKVNIILIFWLQLILNVAWTVVFFGMHSPSLALVEIFMLWFAVLYMIVNFFRVSKAAAYLLIPYILWVSYATVLNYFIWILNLKI